MGASNKTLDDTILAGTGAKTRTGGIAGANISAGQAVYQDSATQRYMLAQADTAAKAAVVGVAAHGAKAGQPLQVIYDGPITGLTGLQVGAFYAVSEDNAGDVMLVDDLTTGDFPTLVLVATSATAATLGILAGGVAVAADVT